MAGLRKGVHFSMIVFVFVSPVVIEGRKNLVETSVISVDGVSSNVMKSEIDETHQENHRATVKELQESASHSAKTLESQTYQTEKLEAVGNVKVTTSSFVELSNGAVETEDVGKDLSQLRKFFCDLCTQAAGNSQNQDCTHFCGKKSG
ncbi:hypothetical protein Mapa_002371 [Marchantia paleacea]|nr:hypothetical protein Mapa_002371 [Marchantia paleacea]